jgi:hypothetical protein
MAELGEVGTGPDGGRRRLASAVKGEE